MHTDTEIQKTLGLGGHDSLMEKWKHSRSSECLLCIVEQTSGLLHTPEKKGQGLWCIVEIVSHVYQILVEQSL